MNLQLESPNSTRTSLNFQPAGLREIRLEYARASRWCEFLEKQCAASFSGSTLSEFVENIDQACWIATWKREHVCLEVSVAEIPVIMSVLAEIGDSCECEIVEEILSALAGFP